MKKRRGIGVLLMALAIAAIAGNALAASGEVDPAVEKDPYAGLPTTQDGEPTLTAEQVDRTMAIVKADPVVQSATTSVDVVQIGPWIERSESGEAALVGATLVLPLDGTTSFPMKTWPAVQYDDDPTESFGDTYSRESATYAVENATQLMVDVDLNRGAVVGVTPEGSAVKYQVAPSEKATEPTGY